MILPPIPSIRVRPFPTSSGSKLPSRPRGDRDRHLAILPLQALAGGAVPPVALARRRLMARLAARMGARPGAEHPLQEPNLQLLPQPGVAEQILRALAALQQFVQQFVGYRHRPRSSQEHGPGHSCTEDLTLPPRRPVSRPGPDVAQAGPHRRSHGFRHLRAPWRPCAPSIPGDARRGGPRPAPSRVSGRTRSVRESRAMAEPG
jgi:hypothetical protein